MSSRKTELTRQAARLFAEKGYHGTSIGDLAGGDGRPEGLALRPHRLEGGPALGGRARRRRRLPRRARRGPRGAAGDREDPARAARAPARHLRAARDRDGLHSRVALPRGRTARASSSPSAGATRSASARSSAKGASSAALRTDLDDATATLLALSAANWAYTWLRPRSDTDELADRFYAFLLDGMRGYATRLIGVRMACSPR